MHATSYSALDCEIITLAAVWDLIDSMVHYGHFMKESIAWRTPFYCFEHHRGCAQALKALAAGDGRPPASAEARGQGPRAPRGRSGSALPPGGSPSFLILPVHVRPDASTDQASRSPRGPRMLFRSTPRAGRRRERRRVLKARSRKAATVAL